MKKNEYNKLSAIVDNFMIENDLPSGWYAKSLAWASRALREIKLDSWGDVKTKLLTVTDRKTCILPEDFVDWVKIGIQRGQYVITLGFNDALTSIPRTTDSASIMGLLSQHMPNGLDFSAYDGCNFYNYDGGSVFGIGGGMPSKGYFKVNVTDTCKELLLDYDYGFTTILLEYITDGFDECSDPYVSPYLYDYIMCYMDYKYECKNNPKATEASRYRLGQDLHYATVKVRARRSNLDPQTLLNLTRAETKLSAKM